MDNNEFAKSERPFVKPVNNIDDEAYDTNHFES